MKILITLLVMILWGIISYGTGALLDKMVGYADGKFISKLFGGFLVSTAFGLLFAICYGFVILFSRT